MKVLFAVEHPEPSDDGPTIDMGGKPTPDGGGDDLQNASIEKLKKFRQVVANSGAIPKEWLLEKIDELM